MIRRCMTAGDERVDYAIDKKCGGCRAVGSIVELLYWLLDASYGEDYSTSSSMPSVGPSRYSSRTLRSRLYSPK